MTLCLDRQTPMLLPCAPYRHATQCSLPSGCQPFSGGLVFPLGISYLFLSFVSFLMFW